MVDGYYISEGICAFIAKIMPEIITDGHLYKCYPPLYNIETSRGKSEFLNSKSDLTEYFVKKVSKNYKVFLEDSDVALKKDELFDFLYDTMEYYDTLKDLQIYFSANMFFIERLANFLIINDIHKTKNLEKYFSSQTFISSLMSYLQEEYPEVILGKRNSLRGIVDGKSISIRLNERNMQKFNDFEDIFKEYGYKLKVYDKDSKNPRIVTIGQFMEETYPLRAKIIQRYKGLGEATGDQIGETCLDPDNRVLVQLTMKDAEKALKTFEKLNGNKKDDMMRRKSMMETYRISRENLDN